MTAEELAYALAVHDMGETVTPEWWASDAAEMSRLMLTREADRFLFLFGLVTTPEA